MNVDVPKEKLEELYVRQRLSCRRIAERFGCNKNIISELLKEKGIKIRTRSEESKLIVHPMKYLISKKTLEELYWKEKLSTYQIRLYRQARRSMQQ